MGEKFIDRPLFGDRQEVREQLHHDAGGDADADQQPHPATDDEGSPMDALREGPVPQEREDQEACRAGDGVDKSFDRDHQERIRMHLLCRFAQMGSNMHERQLEAEADDEAGKRHQQAEEQSVPDVRGGREERRLARGSDGQPFAREIELIRRSSGWQRAGIYRHSSVTGGL